MREFETGATRDSDESKPDYEGFLSPLVVERFGAYMTKHRAQADGKLRASDNWQKGIPLDAYMKSAWRHFVEWWREHRRGDGGGAVAQEALCALLFNVQGYLHEALRPAVYVSRYGPLYQCNNCNTFSGDQPLVAGATHDCGGKWMRVA
jgi:hypothetical protein